jgi:cytochrome c oxidase cbb3-type subunit 1
MGAVLSAAGLQQGFQWMNGAEWVDTVVQMRAYWLVRTLAGISMDVGMSLLIINLMMTALKRPDTAIGFKPRSPSPAPGSVAPFPAGELAG